MNRPPLLCFFGVHPYKSTKVEKIEPGLGNILAFFSNFVKGEGGVEQISGGKGGFGPYDTSK